jgi:hypothetical protein
MSPRLIEIPNPDGGAPLRRFSDPIIQAQIDRAMADIKPESRVGAVVHADGDALAVSVVGRLGRHTTVMAGAFKPWHGPARAEGKLVFEL